MIGMQVLKLQFFITVEITFHLLVLWSSVEIAPIEIIRKPWPPLFHPPALVGPHLRASRFRIRGNRTEARGCWPISRPADWLGLRLSFPKTALDHVKGLLKLSYSQSSV